MPISFNVSTDATAKAVAESQFTLSSKGGKSPFVAGVKFTIIGSDFVESDDIKSADGKKKLFPVFIAKIGDRNEFLWPKTITEEVPVFDTKEDTVTLVEPNGTFNQWYRSLCNASTENDGAFLTKVVNSLDGKEITVRRVPYMRYCVDGKRRPQTYIELDCPALV